MRRSIVAIVLIAGVSGAHARAAGPARKPLGPKEREAILALIKAVDLAQQTDVLADDGVGWSHHVLKGGKQYRLRAVPADPAGRRDQDGGDVCSRRLAPRRPPRARRALDLREWMLHGSEAAPRIPETVYVAAGDMPVGGPAESCRRSSRPRRRPPPPPR